MKINHLALWTRNLEAMRDFYTTYFEAKSNALYHNKKTEFKSYFLSFDDDTRLELMTRSDIAERTVKDDFGYAHLAMSVGTKDRVDDLTNRLAQEGFEVVGQPRTTGDGYYESVVLDPDGNKVELRFKSPN